MSGGADLTGTALWRVQFLGVLGGGEIFDHGAWFSADPGADEAGVAATAELFLTEFLASVSIVPGGTVRNLFPSSTAWHAIRVRPYVQATGLPSADSFDLTVSHAGAGAAASQAAQVAHVVTMHNGRTTGRRRYNRTFLPGVASTVITSAGRISTGQASELATAWAAGAAAAAAGTPSLVLAYYSATSHEFLTLASVIVDDVPDTQRRRRNQLVPVKETVAIP